MDITPKFIREEMNRIAALELANNELKILRDRVLFGYTYFLEPRNFLYHKMEETEGHLLITFPPTDRRSYRRHPLHPLAASLFKEYDGNIPVVDRASAQLIAGLFPTWKPQSVSFDAPTLAYAVMELEGLQDEEMDLILGINRLNAVDMEAFYQHKFFEHLRIRMKTA